MAKKKFETFEEFKNTVDAILKDGADFDIKKLAEVKHLQDEIKALQSKINDIGNEMRKQRNNERSKLKNLILSGNLTHSELPNAWDFASQTDASKRWILRMRDPNSSWRTVPKYVDEYISEYCTFTGGSEEAKKIFNIVTNANENVGKKVMAFLLTNVTTENGCITGNGSFRVVFGTVSFFEDHQDLSKPIEYPQYLNNFTTGRNWLCKSIEKLDQMNSYDRIRSVSISLTNGYSWSSDKNNANILLDMKIPEEATYKRYFQATNKLFNSKACHEFYISDRVSNIFQGGIADIDEYEKQIDEYEKQIDAYLENKEEIVEWKKSLDQLKN